MRIHNPKGKSKAEALAKLPKSKRDAILQSLTYEERAALYFDWAFWSRPNQRIPTGTWFIWLLLAGRGFGKTRSGAEAVRWAVQNGYRRICLAAPTAADCRDVLVEGESGILNVFPNSERPHYEPSKRRVTFKNGAIATLFSAEKPDRFRGPQHDFAWLDEVAAWPNLDAALALLIPSIRLGASPKVVVTTTPRPLPKLKEWLEDPNVVVTRGSTFDNAANLAEHTLKYLRSTYMGTTLGRQELEGELLGGNPGALWTDKIIEEHRHKGTLPELKRIIVAIDPSANQGNQDACECGIVVAGIGFDGHVYILEDLSDHLSPLQWVKVAWDAYVEHGADRIVYEGNLAGAYVETTFRTSAHPNVPLKRVTAVHGKVVRAEPVSALYERGLVHHVGLHKELEDQLTTWVPGKKSPDRLDALVWAVTELALGADPIDASAFDNFNQNDFRRPFYSDDDDDN